jgi:enterobactin synthetase component D
VRAVTFQRTDESLTDASREIRHERVELPEDLTSAAPRRVATFIAGRHCAIHAMTELGVTEGKVLRGKVGSPRWPRGVVGSIAHTDDLAIAAVASARDARSVGVDCERIMTTETADNVREAVAQELRHPGTEVNWRDATEEGAVTCVFSAKETLYKCLNPLTGIFFGFDDASVVRGDLAEGWLELRLNRSLSDAFRRGSIYTVRIVRHRGYFVSGMLLES